MDISLDQNRNEFQENTRTSESSLQLLQCLTISNEPGTCVIDTSDGFTDGVLYPSGNLLLEWTPRTKQQSIKFEHRSHITALAYNRNANLGASAEDDPLSPKIIVWELTTYESLLEIDLHGTVSFLEFSNDGLFLAALEKNHTDGVQRVLIWDFNNDTCLSPSFAASIAADDLHNCLKFSTTSSNLLVSNGSKTVYFWEYDILDPTCMKCLAPIMENIKKNENFTFSTFMPNGSDAITGTTKGNIILWKSQLGANNEQVSSQDIEKSYLAVKSLNIQPHKISFLTTKRGYLIVGSRSGNLSFLDANLKLVHWMDGFGEGYIRSISFSKFCGGLSISESDFIIETNGAIFQSTTCKKETNKTLWKGQWLQNATVITTHPRKAHIAAIEDSSNSILIFNYNTLEEIHRKKFNCTGHITCIAYFRDGTQICAGSLNGGIYILNEEDLQLNSELQNCKCQIVRVTINASGEYLAAHNEKGELMLYILHNVSSDLKKWGYQGKLSTSSLDLLQSFDFYDTPDGQSHLFALRTSGQFLEIDLHNSNSVSGLLYTVLLDRSIKSHCFCITPPGGYFERSSSNTDIVSAGLDGKLHVQNLKTKTHVYTYLSPLGEIPITQFGFFQTEKSPQCPLMWYVSEISHIVGITLWPLSIYSQNIQTQITVDGRIKGVRISYDGKFLVLQTTSGISVWKIPDLSSITLRKCEFNAEDYLEDETLSRINEFFQLFESMNSENGVNTVQMELIMCALGFFPTVEEFEDMVSECKIQSKRQFDKEWSGYISRQSFISLFIRYKRPENIEEITRCFNKVLDGQQEILREDLIWKMDSNERPIEKVIETSIHTVFNETADIETKLRPFSEHINLENFLEWLKIEHKNHFE